MFENNQGKSKNHVVYKGKKYDIYPEFQVYNQKKVPLRCLNMWDVGIGSLEEIEGLKEASIQSLKLDRNGISELEGIGD